MTEIAKTGVYVGIAAAALLWAYLVQPRTIEVAEQADTGRFFDPFPPGDCTSMEVVAYDEDTASTKTFKVAQTEGALFTIPSHENYPADARDHLATAAASVMDLEKLGLATKNKADHAEYGVIDPAKMEEGETGVGKRVTLEGKSGKTLAQFIIGKPVKAQEQLRYVRTPDSDAVYRVKVAVDKLSTKFEDWIEKDLLKLSTFDIKQINLRNYSIDESMFPQLRMVPGESLDLSYEDMGSKWVLAEMNPGEELDNEKLNAMKTALGDLKIVDVRKKPASLAALFRGETNRLIAQDDQSLRSKGFFFIPDHGLLSNEGEVLCRMKDGIEYTLRFGEIAANTGSIDEKEQEKADKEKTAEETGKSEADASKPKGSNRYIFVTAAFRPELIPMPELPDLPEDTAVEGPAKPADEAKKPEDETKKDETKKEAAKPESGDDCQEKTGETKPAETKPDDQPKADATDPPAKPGDPAAEPESKRELAKRRKEIEQQRKRMQDEYDEKIKKGQEREKVLNERFANWYYVISDEVYRKIHLSRADIIKPGTSPAANLTPDALNKIKEEGLKPKTPDEPEPN